MRFVSYFTSCQFFHESVIFKLNDQFLVGLVTRDQFFSKYTPLIETAIDLTITAD